MKRQEQFDKETILLEKSFVDCEPIGDGELGAQIEELMLKLIDENKYLAARSEREKHIFHKLVSVCATLAHYAKGSVSAHLYPYANKALIFITATSFEFAHPCLNKLYNIIIATSRMTIDTDKFSNNVRMTVEFSFEKNTIRIIDLFEKLDKIAESKQQNDNI